LVVAVLTRTLANSTAWEISHPFMVVPSGEIPVLIRRLKTAAVAIAAIGALLLGGATQARADILLTLSAGGTTESYDVASNNVASEITSIDGYNLNVETVVTNYPGSVSGGSISTTVNVLGAVTVADTLTVTAQLITPGAVAPGGPYVATTPPNPPGFVYNTQPLLAWQLPSTSPVIVSAGASFAPTLSVSGTPVVTTTTYYDSPPAATLSGSTAVVTQTQAPPALNSVQLSNSGTYSLSQTVTLSGINVGATGFNFGGTSAVSPAPLNSVPEPSSLAIAGIGALCLAGYGLRRRKALGA
jgi:hypothetical protein